MLTVAFRRWLLALVVLSMLVTACLPEEPEGPNLWEVLNQEEDYSTFRNALVRAGYQPTLEAGFIYTLLAPDNAAFDEWLQANGFANIDAIPLRQLQLLMSYHVQLGQATIDELGAGYFLTPCPASPDSFGVVIFFRNVNGEIQINNGVSIERQDIVTSSGVMHGLDGVLDIPTVQQIIEDNPNFSTLEAAIAQAGLIDSLRLMNPITMLAPSNSAFSGLLSDLQLSELSDIPDSTLRRVILTHVLRDNFRFNDLANSPSSFHQSWSGDTTRVRTPTSGILSVNDSIGSFMVDIQASNGVLHFINDVIYPN